jgi:hypothetical protein
MTPTQPGGETTSDLARGLSDQLDLFATIDMFLRSPTISDQWSSTPSPPLEPALVCAWKPNWTPASTHWASRSAEHIRIRCRSNGITAVRKGHG